MTFVNPLTATGAGCDTTLLIPSCPNALLPQTTSVPSAFNATVCAPPAATETTPDAPETLPGTRPSSVLPSCWAPLPHVQTWPAPSTATACVLPIETRVG